ncbi:formyltetrahydrofolate deformylase [Lichenihabitans psoromatis]|nr:formyltetrahydrofolate deformylase [Lichenihabitans psoromatis]
MSPAGVATRAHLLTLTCEDRPGIVARVSAIIAKLGGNISESAQFWERSDNGFYMRIAFSTSSAVVPDVMRRALQPTVEQFGLKARLTDAERSPRIIVLVSKFDHCLQHILYQVRVGWLKATVAAIVSNHRDSERTAELAGIPFHWLPVTKDSKAEQESRVLALIDETNAELVVLARYMQVLSDGFTSTLAGHVINIHHSFLPSFKGAKPYHQAHERGVKLIGATAHYVTPELDEGPIIEQETERVTHALSPEDYVAVGRNIEARVLARAVKLHVEQRVLLNGTKTVVF